MTNLTQQEREMKQSDKKSDSFDISWIVGIALFLGFVVTVLDITIWRA